MKRLYLMAVAASFAVLAFAGSALAATATPGAPTVDVNAYFTGIFDALNANLTTVLVVSGLMAGLFMVLGLIRRGKRG